MQLPKNKIDFLLALTDDTALLQHSKYSVPSKKEGYTTDDNARAIIACVKHSSLLGKSKLTEKLIEKYLSFLLYMQKQDGTMHNWLGYNRRFMDKIGSEDCMGQTLWACGQCLDSKLPEDTKMLSKEIFDQTFKQTSKFTSPRAKAFTIMGLCHYYKAYPDDRNISINIRYIGEQLTKQFERESSPEWQWFEPYLTYANARLPHSLFLAYDSAKEPKLLETAVKSIDFLIKVQSKDKVFIPIGNKGWYRKGGVKALYDQQSVEAASMTEALIAAFSTTNGGKYLQAAYQVFQWFFGKNIKHLEVYDPQDGSCYDGITQHGLNLNKGAESAVTYLQARLALEEKRSQDKKNANSDIS